MKGRNQILNPPYFSLFPDKSEILDQKRTFKTSETANMPSTAEYSGFVDQQQSLKSLEKLPIYGKQNTGLVKNFSLKLKLLADQKHEALYESSINQKSNNSRDMIQKKKEKKIPNRDSPAKCQKTGLLEDTRTIYMKKYNKYFTDDKPLPYITILFLKKYPSDDLD